MNRVQPAVLSIALVVLLAALSPAGTRVARAQASTAAHWQVQVDNVSPPDHNWSFNSFYPSHLQAHAGDTITFAVAPNPNAFHAVMLMAPTWFPSQGYPGFSYTDDDDDPPTLAATYFISKPFFAASPSTLCGRGGNAPCVFNGQSTVALKSGVLVNPPADGSGAGNPSFSLTLDPGVKPGTYFFLCLVHGPSMSGSIDILPSDQPAQSADNLKADATREYNADLNQLTDLSRASSFSTPQMITNPDSTRSWTIAAGGGATSGNLSINEFGVHDLFIRPGDSVTWVNQSPEIVAHTVTGFGTQPGQPPPSLSPYQPVCGGPNPDQSGEDGPDTFYPPGSGHFAPDIWNNCPPWQMEDHLTQYAMPSAPSGSSYTDGSITSGLLLQQSFIDSSVGLGLPFAGSYTLTFPNAGTYTYTCAIHAGMTGTIIVLPTPTPIPAS